MLQSQFNKGDQVEVINPSHGSNAPYHPAIVLRPIAKDKAHILVQYQTLTNPNADTPRPINEIVELRNVRPMPPKELHQFFKIGDDVDAYRDKGWSRGTVMDILENSKYVVVLQGQEFECEQFNLRLHREWADGSWVPPFQQQENSSGPAVKPKRLVVKCSRLGPRFENGTMVEVSSDEEGYKGAWYMAEIIAYMGNDKFLVEYQHLVTDDGTELLREETYGNYARPCPPRLPSVPQFKLLQRVDAWYNEGWWEGAISKVLTGSKYAVYFSSSNEDMVFKHAHLRPHKEWMNGRWVHSYGQHIWT